MATDIKNDPTLSTSLLHVWEFNDDATDSHGSENLTVVNSPSYITGKQGNAIDLNGTSQGARTSTDFTTLSGTSAMSMSFWYKPDTDQTGFRLITGINDAAVETYQFWKNGAGNDYRWQLRTTVGPYTVTIAESVIGTGSWKHVVCTFGSNVIELWVDGVSRGTTATSGSITSSWPAPFGIGYRPDGLDGYVDGGIDQVCLWSKKLSNTEIADLYNSGSGIPYEAVGGTTFTPKMMMF